MEAGQNVLPNVPGVAVFDTAFHRTMPDVAAFYAIPPDLAEKHALRRHGFHGISHQYVSQKLLQCLNRPAVRSRLITCHLGNGASLCAIRDGKSIDTSMGLTPLEGLMMGTRSGDIDPGLVLHLMISIGMRPKKWMTCSTAAAAFQVSRASAAIFGTSNKRPPPATNEPS